MGQTERETETDRQGETEKEQRATGTQGLGGGVPAGHLTSRGKGKCNVGVRRIGSGLTGMSWERRVSSQPAETGGGESLPQEGRRGGSSRPACLGRPHCRCRPAEWLARMMTCPPKPGPFLPHLLLHRPPNNGLVSISRQNGGIYGCVDVGQMGLGHMSCPGPKESLTLGPLPHPDARGRCAPSTHTVVRKARVTPSRPRTGGRFLQDPQPFQRGTKDASGRGRSLLEHGRDAPSGSSPCADPVLFCNRSAIALASQGSGSCRGRTKKKKRLFITALVIQKTKHIQGFSIPCP